MLARGFRFMIAAVLVLGMALALPCSDALAERGGGRGGGHHRGGHGWYRGGWHGWGHPGRYYYHGDRWYRNGWFWFDVAVTSLVVGAIIDSLPPRHTTLVVAGTPYYYYDGYYYRPYQYGGYVVVEPPAPPDRVIVMPDGTAVLKAEPARVVETPQAAVQPQMQDTVTINIPNAQGGYTAITLKRSGPGYVGPQGEYYSGNPTVEQLQALYGK